MKLWLILRKYKHLKQLPLLKRFFGIEPQVFKLFVCFASISLVLPGDVSLWQKNQTTTIVSKSSQSPTTIEQIAANITVKILAPEALGSGILWESYNSSYIVITNQHVLRAGEPPYYIQTPDGQIHHARILSNSHLDGYDIAILRFHAVHNFYQTARLGNLSTLAVGESVFAAGFPHNQENINFSVERSPDILPGLALKSGLVSIVLDKALEEGYQIGYTSDVQKGMSGGPLLNSKGEVVGINGKHAYPLWDAPDFYKDGSQPCPPLQKLITRSSLAIPMQKILQLTPPSTFLSEYDKRLPIESSQPRIVVNSNQENGTKESIAQMQAEAELSKSCRELSQELDLSEVN